MLEKVKLALRYRNNLFDEEINVYIDSCFNNLKLADIDEAKLVETDNNIVNVVICYCKWQLNFQDKGQEWERVYKDLKTAIALDKNYSVH